MKNKATRFYLSFVIILTLLSLDLKSERKIYEEFKFNNNKLELKLPEVNQAIASPNNPKYLLFNNLNLDASHPAYAQEAYIDVINKDPELSKLFTYKAFGPSAFTEPITNYDVVIFPTGDIPINAAVNGITILSKMRELIAAGKKIILTGRNIYTWAYDPNSPAANDEIRKFIEDTLGIKFVKRIPVSTTSGSSVSFNQYTILGDAYDPISFSARIECNIGFKLPETPMEYPIAYYVSIDAFKSKDKAKFHPSYHFNSYTSDTLIATKTQIGEAKIITWVVGFENFALSGSRLFAIKYGIKWLMEEAPAPGAQIEVLDESLKFGNVPIGKSDTKILSFRNIGSKELSITDIIIDWDDYNVFSIENTPKFPLKLASGEVGNISIKFTPKKNDSYDAILTIKSNSQTFADKVIPISGNGGTGSGAVITSSVENNKLLFGTVPKGGKNIITFEIKNTGDKELNLQKIEFVKNDDKAFIIDQGSSYPYSIPVNGSRVMKIRFVPPDNGKKYTGQLNFEHDGINDNPFALYMEGEGEAINSINENEITLKLFPNPANDFITIKSENPVSESITIFDSNGNLIKSFKNINFIDGQFKLNTLDLINGLYFIQLKQNNKLEILPLIIDK